MYQRIDNITLTFELDENTVFSYYLTKNNDKSIQRIKLNAIDLENINNCFENIRLQLLQRELRRLRNNKEKK